MKWFKCIHCKCEKHENEFYKDRSKSSGHKPRCKSCDLLSRDKKKRAKYEKEYWSNKKEKRRSIVLKSHNKNKEHHKIQRKKYLSTEKGKEMYRMQTQKRYALRKKAFVENINPKSVFINQDGICYICKKVFEFKQMELDHIVPLSRGGKHMLSNVKMACVHCNRSKGAKLPEEVCYQVV